MINEAYLRTAQHRTDAPLDRGHFLRLAARAMRQVLLDHGRGRRAIKRQNVAIAAAAPDATLPVEDYLAINSAIEKLDAMDPHLAALVEVRFFAGLSIPEAAAALAVSEATVKRDWSLARAWLRAEFGLEDSPE